MKAFRVASLALLSFSLPVLASESDLFKTIRKNALPRCSAGACPERSARAGTTRSIAATLRAGVTRNATTTAAVAHQTKTVSDLTVPRVAGQATVLYRANGTPRQIRGGVLHPSNRMSANSAAGAIDTARQFLRANRGLLRLEDPDRELAVTSRSTDDLGRTHVRFEQQFETLTVWPAEMIVHLDESGNVDLVEGGYIPTPRRMRTRPALGASEAITRAEKACGTAKASVPELIVYSRDDRRPRLAWKMTLTESLVERWLVVVDAMNGAILERFNTIETANVVGSGRDLAGTTRQLNVWQQGSTFLLLDSSKAMFDPTSQPPSPQTTRGGIFVFDAQNQPPTDEPKQLPASISVTTSSSASSWPVPDTVSASYWLSQTYDYYLDRHGRNSIDGMRGSLNAIVRLGLRFANAFWSHEQGLMVFGDDDTYAGSLDVIAHEMTHGVTGYSAKLVYRDQSGAINEAMSDIFGEMAEARTFGSNDWLLGSQTKDPKRSMSDPRRFGDPAKMSEFVNTTQDNGGVHINSGIINHAYYQLVEGLPGAISKRDGERIFYRTLTQHLTKDSQFIDVRLAAISSAEELFGAGSAQARKTGEAFDKVEIFGANPTPKDPPIPVVNGPDATVFVYKDPQNGAYFLGRKEVASDGALGSTLSRFSILNARPSVSSDGTLAVFVDSIRDVCLIPTNSSAEETCLDLPDDGIRVSSVGMSPDGTIFGFVLFGADGTPENDIIVVDAVTGNSQTYTVDTPVFDGATLSSIEYADAMAFTADGQYLVFDALNLITANGQPWEAWSIYAVDLNSGTVFTVIPPVEGLEIFWPALGHTSDNLMTFEAYDPATGNSGIVTTNLLTDDLIIAATSRGVDAVPSFTGDDRAVVYAIGASNATGASLVRQNLAADQVTPVGSPSTWIEGAAFGVIYRRGTYSGPTTQPGSLSFGSPLFTGIEGSIVTVSVVRAGGNKGTASVSYSTTNGTASAGSDFQTSSGTLSWGDGEDGPRTFQVRLLTDSASEGTEVLNLLMTGASGATLGSPSNATLSIINAAPPPSGGRRRAVKR